MIGEDKIDFIEVVSQIKTEKVAVINYLKFREALSDWSIIPYGEDLDEEFQIFLSLSASREDLVMVRKLKKWIVDIKNFKYFSYFGYYFREEETVDSDFEKENDKANKTVDKLIKEQTKQNKLKENNKSMWTHFSQ